MAQRAYRNRKDNAITDLEQKVKDLEKSQSDMSNEVSSFFDMIHSQPGALERDPEVARRFRELHAKFLGTGKGQLQTLIQRLLIQLGMACSSRDKQAYWAPPGRERDCFSRRSCNTRQRLFILCCLRGNHQAND